MFQNRRQQSNDKNIKNLKTDLKLCVLGEEGGGGRIEQRKFHQGQE